MISSNSPDVTLSAACQLAAVVSGISVLALLLFYALELRASEPYLFGPTSDVGTVAWDLLLIVVVSGLRPALGASRGADVLVFATIVICAAGAVASALLTIGAMAFEIATPVAVVAILVQSLWLHLVSRRLRGTTWSTTVVRLGWWAPVAQAVGAVVVAASLVLPWSTPPQLVVMIIGIVVGLPGWAAWPLWFQLAAREALRHGVPVRQLEHPQPQEDLPCPTFTASTTSP